MHSQIEAAHHIIIHQKGAHTVNSINYRFTRYTVNRNERLHPVLDMQGHYLDYSYHCTNVSQQRGASDLHLLF